MQISDVAPTKNSVGIESFVDYAPNVIKYLCGWHWIYVLK